jgi:plastocyanin domain-containing protein
MKVIRRVRIFTGIGAAALAVAFGSGFAGAAATDGGAVATDPEIQRISIEATARGFVPDTVKLTAGVPAEMVFTRTMPSGCAAQVHIPDFGVGKTALPQGEAVTISIKPTAAGVHEFRCGMDMLRGVIVVKPGAGT